MKDLSQLSAPLYQAARAFLGRGYISMHVPLHGRGPGAPHLVHSGLAPLLRWDFTEVENLDDLHLPVGALRKAQTLAARLFGAERSFFLVNGVTGGLLALLLALVRPGEKVLLSRLAHKAVLHGIMICGAVPVYLPIKREPRSGFPLNVTVATVRAALQRHPDARLLLVTSPSYWGVTAELKQMAELARDHGILFVVDEAHGAHLPFYGDLPHGAAAKADFWLHSGHKSLGALTPGAFLHLGAAHPVQKLRFWLQAMQTSSPPYPVMISLDLARRQAALRGKTLFQRARHWAEQLRHALMEENFTLLCGEAVRDAGFALDPCRITLLLQHGGGLRLAKRLAQSCRLQVETAGENYLLAICGPAQLDISPRALARAAARVAPVSKPGFATPLSLLPPFCFARKGGDGGNLDPFPLAPGVAAAMPAALLPLEECAGRICAEMVVTAPPGIPLLAPGERIAADMLAVLLQLRARGSRFQGAADPTLRRIKVVTAGA